MLSNPALDIATGTSRRTKSWKNITTTWSDLLARMSATVRTQETLAEYKAMPRSQQAEVKDTGGFVGGYCNNGTRTDIRHRSLLTLDADFALPGLWSDWCLTQGYAAAIYSTHKHTPESPRLRLVVPLSRPVSSDEYQAIARRVAADLGIDQFDDSTYQPQRLMYWPSTSRDGEFVFESLDGPLLDADATLSRYTDWSDISSWPVSSRVAGLSRKAADKQADPLTKSGLVGAFCRAYTIHEAIEAFVPTYITSCDDPTRYTYTEGSTAGGVVTYENKFAYSFHGTDPASGQLCNAWDLVRLHRFGRLDADVDPTKPVTSRPSWAAMIELVLKDERARAQIVADRTAEAREDFSAAAPVDWFSRLKVTKDGGIASTIENVVLILGGDPELAGALAYNEMTNNIETKAPLPWRQDLGAWTDADDSALRYFLEKKYGVSGKDKIFDGVNVAAQENRFHPVREYLAGCIWDNVPRVDTLLIDYLGAEDTPYTRAVTRKALVAAVARILQPGCKFDHMLTIRGKQGLGKSALIAKLGGAWYSDSFTTVQGKDAYEQVLGRWLVEVGELAGMKRAEAESIKLFISKQVDRFRPAYGRRIQEFPRQCVFIGTTNESQFLRDTTGNRRFWVVDTPNAPARDMWAELTPEMIRLIWAEAVERFHAGEDLFLADDMEAVAREIQEGYEEENPREGLVAAYLARKLPEDWDSRDLFSRRAWLEGAEEGTKERTRVCCLEVWSECLGGSPERLDRYASAEINNILLRQPDWGKMRSHYDFPIYGRQRYFRKDGLA